MAAVSRLLRILLSATTGLSLLLCVAVVILWVRSQWVGDALVFSAGTHIDEEFGDERDRVIVLATCDGRAVLRAYDVRPWDAPAGGRPAVSDLGWSVADDRLELRDEDGGFLRFGRTRGGNTATCWAPLWAVALATGLLPALRFVRRARAAPRRKFACRACGYDLRATPDRCPECGTAPSSTGPK